MTEPESHTLAYLRRLDEKLDRIHSEVGERVDRVEAGSAGSRTSCSFSTASLSVWKGARSRPRG